MRDWRRACGAVAIALAAIPSLAQEEASPQKEPRPRAQHHAPSGASSLAPLPVPLNLTATATGGSVSVYEADEVLTLQSSNDEAARADALMRVAGGRLIRRQKLASLGFVLSTYRVATGARLPETLQSIVDRTPELLADLNHRYQLAGDAAAAEDSRTQSFFARRIGWSQELAACAHNRAIGLLDTTVARDHPALRRARIRTFSALPAGVDEAAADHGTAIATLLVGDPAVPRHEGLVPQARLFAATVFRSAGGTPQTNAEWLAVGLDWLVSQDVRVVNVSVGGPSNRVLARAVEEALARGMVLVAAAGNGGAAAAPQYPAAWDPVIAVTAVDANDAPFGDANQGTYLDFAAPGVDVWAGSATAGRFYSGTSFAAPFVTAAVAAIGDDAEHQLTLAGIDLGAPGPDATFGRGRLRFEGVRCGAP